MVMVVIVTPQTETKSSIWGLQTYVGRREAYYDDHGL